MFHHGKSRRGRDAPYLFADVAANRTVPFFSSVPSAPLPASPDRRSFSPSPVSSLFIFLPFRPNVTNCLSSRRWQHVGSSYRDVWPRRSVVDEISNQTSRRFNGEARPISEIELKLILLVCFFLSFFYARNEAATSGRLRSRWGLKLFVESCER